LALGLVAFPAGVLAWILLSGSHRGEYLRSRWVRLGRTIILISALPLIYVAIEAALGTTAAPNPVGPGLLFLAGALLGAFIAGIGAAMVALQESPPERP
jgi:hypothetical protein